MLKLRKNKKGFTLVELIVVIAIMAVLAGTVAGVTVSQLNKQTNNTAKSEAQTLASDLYNFMIDYTLPAGTAGTDGTTPPVTPGTTNTAFTMLGDDRWDSKDGINTVSELTYAVLAFVSENNQTGNIKVVSLVGDDKAPEKKGDIKGNAYGSVNYKAGDHKFYAVVYKDRSDYKVRFCCEQKGNGNNQFPFADYTYGDVLAD